MGSREVCVHNKEIKDNGDCSCRICYPLDQSSRHIACGCDGCVKDRGRLKTLERYLATLLDDSECDMDGYCILGTALDKIRKEEDQ